MSQEGQLIRTPEDRFLQQCQNCILGLNADKCDQCCNMNGHKDGHCGSYLGMKCWCSKWLIVKKATTAIPTTTSIPTTTIKTTTPEKTIIATTPYNATSLIIHNNNNISLKSSSSSNMESTTGKNSNTTAGDISIVWPILGGSVAIVIILIAVVSFRVIWARSSKSKSDKKENVQLQESSNEDTISSVVSNTDNNRYDLLYNSAYIISPETVQLDRNDPTKLLGEGKFGRIFQGKLLQGNSDSDQSEWCNVAVKSVRQNSTSHYKKSLLGEIKILTYIGRHNYILKFLGCYTIENENSFRETFLILELCSNGSLKNFLSQNFSNFTSCIKNDNYFNNTALLTNTNKPSDWLSFSTKNLLIWSHQIACGMEFLASKKIIHNDMAARNILLNEDKVAKISDFGLSRIMDHTNQCYTKKSTEEPIPWPWMAPESLKNFQFSTESDIWSYGVTLWEIFTLGDDPYENITDDFDLYRKLQGGHRLEKPKYATCEIYMEILLCWRVTKSERPTFENLRTFFEKQSEILQHILEQPGKRNQVTIQLCTDAYSKPDATVGTSSYSKMKFT